MGFKIKGIYPALILSITPSDLLISLILYLFHILIEIQITFNFSRINFYKEFGIKKIFISFKYNYNYYVRISFQKSKFNLFPTCMLYEIVFCFYYNHILFYERTHFNKFRMFYR